MAGIARRKNGTVIIRFVGLDRKRRTLGLGKCSDKQATGVWLRVENILSAAKTGRPVDPETDAWLANINDRMRQRLQAVGLIDAPAAETDAENAVPATLAAFLDRYLASRKDVKRATRINWGHTQRNLLAFFGADRALASITPGDAKDFERYLKGEARQGRYGDAEATDGLKPDTVRKRIANAKQFFADAVAREWIARNPFAGLKGGQRGNRQRDYFLTRDDAQKVIDACPNAEWRLLFALSRFGGLRCPSEHLALTWADIDWAAGRMRVHSPKTEHHEGKESRLVPLFPEVREHLAAVFDAAAPGTKYVIDGYRDASKNFRTRMERIIKRAGLKPWPKLFANLRASRATELASEFPGHVAAEWLGHSTLVAQRHYWQVTDADFERAISGALHLRSSMVTQEAEIEVRNASPTAVSCGNSQGVAISMGDEGLEPPTSTV
jgi:integrase